MEKPSRRRHPLLRPLAVHRLLRLPRLTRFILPHAHHVRLRMGKRGRQIRRSATMGNISKKKRGPSRFTPRRTCQTLASKSKVEASDKCDVEASDKCDADPIHDTSGGAGQVAQVNNFEVAHRVLSSRPPLDLLKIPDEFKSLKTDRLVPCDLKNTSSSAMQQYDAYLQWFYNSHRGPAPAASLPDTASMYLVKENSMMSMWLNSNAFSNTFDSIVDRSIARYMNTAIKEKGEIEHPYAFDAVECLAKEVEWICEWLRRGRIFFVDDEYILCHKVRAVAAELFITRRKWSFQISAALVGIRKEAEWLIENLKSNSGESISTSMKIRQFAIDFVLEKFAELEPFFDWGNKTSEMADSESGSGSGSGSESGSGSGSESESDSESDSDDVADNDCVGTAYDELYG